MTEAVRKTLSELCVGKRRRRERESVGDSDEEEEEQQDQVDDDDGSEEFEEESFVFKFSKSGESVAVFYDDRFYIGQVVNVIDDNLAVVNFMHGKENENVFKWPLSEDVDKVESKFIFHSNFDIFPKSGRVWTVSDWSTLLSRWSSFKRLFC